MLDNREHSFNIGVAKLHGIPAAIIIKNLAFWIEKNRANGKHCHEGRYWTYNSYKAWAELFPYLSAKQLRTTLDKLVRTGILLKGNFNRSAYDRTNWYAFKNEKDWLQSPSMSQQIAEKSLCPNGQVEKSIGNNGKAPLGKPIPDSNTDSKQTDTTPLPPKGDEHEISFDDFWKLYDKKNDRVKAETKWKKLNAEEQKAIMAYLPAYIKSTPDKQYRKNPCTFLNNRAWENEIISQHSTKGDMSFVDNFDTAVNWLIDKFQSIVEPLETPFLTEEGKARLNALIKKDKTGKLGNRMVEALITAKEWNNRGFAPSFKTMPITVLIMLFSPDCKMMNHDKRRYGFLPPLGQYEERREAQQQYLAQFGVAN